MPEWGLADPRPPSVGRSEAVPPSDARRRTRALEALFADPGVDVFDLRVGQGKDGSLGVRSVTGAEDLFRARRLVGALAQAEPPARAALPAFCREPRDEGEAGRCVRTAIAAEPGAFVDRLRVRFEARTGALTLEGRAYHIEAARLAGLAARRVGGVLVLVNRLDAAPAVPREDARMEEELRGRIGLRQDLEGADIRVTIRDGIVTLAGFVADESTRDRVRSLAEQVRGVRGVEDRLERGPSSGSR